jgi:hypothetical protein
MPDMNVNSRLVDGEGAIGSSNELDVKDAAARLAMGTKADAAVVVLPADGSVIALLKGVITSIQTLNDNLVNLKAVIGAINDAAEVNPASNATVIAALKGILTETIANT